MKPRGENGLAQTWSEEQEERIVNPSVQAPLDSSGVFALQRDAQSLKEALGFQSDGPPATTARFNNERDELEPFTRAGFQSA